MVILLITILKMYDELKMFNASMDLHPLHALKKVMYYLLLCAMRSIFHHKKIMYLRYRAKLDVSFTSNHFKIYYDV